MNNDHFLYIEEANGTDTGFYVCELSNKAGKTKKTFQVQIITKPVISDSDKITLIEVF